MRNISPSIIAADFTKLEKEIMIVEDLSTDKGVKFATKFLHSHKTMMAID